MESIAYRADRRQDPAPKHSLWVVGGLHGALGVNIYAELATAIPKAGGPYVYARRALGDSAGLLIGWSDWLSNIASIAAA
jgi:basic amino acid/polyamine antiporter, APA family